MIEQEDIKKVTYTVQDEEDYDTILQITNDFSEDIQFKVCSKDNWITLDQLKEIKKCVDRAIREANKVF